MVDSNIFFGPYREKLCILKYFSTYSFISLIGSYHNLRISLNLQYLFLANLQRLQAVRSVALRGKFYRLPPNKENTDLVDSYHSPSTQELMVNHYILQGNLLLSYHLFFPKAWWMPNRGFPQPA